MHDPLGVLCILRMHGTHGPWPGANWPWRRMLPPWLHIDGAILQPKAPNSIGMMSTHKQIWTFFLVDQGPLAGSNTHELLMQYWMH